MERRSFRVAVIAPPCLAVPPAGYGGTELVIAELIDGLIEQGVEPTLFAAPGSRGGFEHGCEIRTPLGGAIWPPDDALERRHCQLAFDEIARRGFDLVHAHCPTAAELAGGLDVPLVLTIHHDRNARDSARYARAPGIHYAFISDRQRALEIPLASSAVVHHGLSAVRYPASDGQGGYAVFIGRFSKCKGLHHAIEASACAELPLLAAGKPHPPDMDYFASTLADALRSPHVEWIGEADHARKLRLLGNARALLFPIEWDEPFGLVVIEAMLCGTPVIAFPRGAVPELVEEGVTGFLVSSVTEMAAALRALGGGGFDREACRARAVERFGRDAMVSRYLSLYARALERGTEHAETHG